MKKPFIIRFATVGIATALLGVGAMFAEPAARSEQAAMADSFEYTISPTGSSCRGCCPGGDSLCCDVPEECKIRN
ncbi:MAG TPA: hypothetical protein VFQ76_07915 [Longimicrobiaceae bacterium]|nr:hypothetical protein [Longimicrobiaceae bacterium]